MLSASFQSSLSVSLMVRMRRLRNEPGVGVPTESQLDVPSWCIDTQNQKSLWREFKAGTK